MLLHHYPLRTLAVQLIGMVIAADHMSILMRFDTPEVIGERPKLGFWPRIQLDAVGHAAGVITRHFVTIFGVPVQPVIGRAINGVPIEGGGAAFVSAVDPVNRRSSLQLAAIDT